MAMNILISAYACSPAHGSEAALGWNYVLGLDSLRRYSIHVIVEEEKWMSHIRDFLTKNPEELHDTTFHFIKKRRARFLRKLWPPSYYIFYRWWQIQAYKLAVRLNRKLKFDQIHQLNMVGFREPGYLWRLKIPMVWGPIGGMENTPWSYVWRMSAYFRIFYSGRNIINSLHLRYLRRPRFVANLDYVKLIAATEGTRRQIFRFWGVDSVVIPEVGLVDEVGDNVKSPADFDFSHQRLVWNGQLVGRKNLAFLLNVLNGVTFPVHLDVVGDGSERKRLLKIASKLPPHIQVTWHGHVSRDEALRIMRSSDLFVFTSVTDLTATVILEALSLGLPVVCLKYGGYGDIISPEIGKVIDIKGPSKDIVSYREILSQFHDYPQQLVQMSKSAREKALSFNWQDKVKKMSKLYEE